jgi:phosphate starvation-inducible PhoH-like protein
MEYLAKTPGQAAYIKALQSQKPVVVTTGPAGCGKTRLACEMAIDLLEQKKCQRIILTRPIVAADEDMGYLPGDIDKKMEPWVRPMYDVFEKSFSLTKMERYIEIAPLGYMRGRTFNDTFIIADEMQNSTINQIKMVMTRLGENSKMVISGDLEQSDLTGKPNGLWDLTERMKTFEGEFQYIERIKMRGEDIVRHPAVEEILKIYKA